MSNVLPVVNKKSVGVLYAPFQVACLTELHGKILSDLGDEYNTVVVALPVRRITPSKVSPLDFRTRQEMILTSFPNVLVVPVVDEKYPQNKIKALESAVRALFSEFRSADLHCDTALGEMYLEHKGKFPHFSQDILEREEASRKATRAFPDWDEVYDYQEAFRRGIIYGLTNQFPISWSTVDICIKRVIDGKTFILLGKKPGEHGWRFPGGFKDRGDMSYEIAVHREASEEVLKEGVNAKETMSAPKYIGSKNINDWRYVKEIDGITTLFYQVIFVGKDEDVKAGDDLADAEWFELSTIKDEIMEGEHVNLLHMLRAFEAVI